MTSCVFGLINFRRVKRERLVRECVFKIEMTGTKTIFNIKCKCE